ncbi:MAG: hypothetical protein PHN82_06715 [bacterium]|nr:hypothetical protein [bacterium]
MAGDLRVKNMQLLCIVAAAVILGSFLVFRQVFAIQREKVLYNIERMREIPSPQPLTVAAAAPAREETRKIVEVTRDLDSVNILEEYEKEERRPELLQIFRLGSPLPQRKVEGVEYVKTVFFRQQIGTRRVLADISMHNDSGVPVSPRFQVMLFSQKGRFVSRDTVLYITDEIIPGEKRNETLSFPVSPERVGFFEVRRLD